MTRREILAMAPALFAAQHAGGQTPKLRNMGIAPTACVVRARANRQTFDLVEHCHSFGMGGLETRLPALDADAAKKFRQKLDSYQMRAVLNAPLPRDESGVAAFDNAVKMRKDAGAY